MKLLQNLEARLRALTPAQASALLLAENVVTIFAGAVAAGHGLVRAFGHGRVAPEPKPIAPAKVLFTASMIVLNTAVTHAGWWLWRNGAVRSARVPAGARSSMCWYCC